MLKNISKLFLVSALIFSLFIFFGCSKSVKYVCSDGSVVSDTSRCAPVPSLNSITQPEVSSPDVFRLAKGESVFFEGKKITLVNLLSNGKSTFSVSGVSVEVESTKKLEIINGLEIVVQSIDYNFTSPDLSTISFKVSPLVLNSDEYLFFVGEPLIIDRSTITLRGVTPSYIVVDTDDVLGMKIYPGGSKVVSGLNITSVKSFPHGIRADDYAILRINKV